MAQLAHFHYCKPEGFFSFIHTCTSGDSSPFESLLVLEIHPGSCRQSKHESYWQSTVKYVRIKDFVEDRLGFKSQLCHLLDMLPLGKSQLSTPQFSYLWNEDSRASQGCDKDNEVVCVNLFTQWHMVSCQQISAVSAVATQPRISSNPILVRTNNADRSNRPFTPMNLQRDLSRNWAGWAAQSSDALPRCCNLTLHTCHTGFPPALAPASLFSGPSSLEKPAMNHEDNSLG